MDELCKRFYKKMNGIGDIFCVILKVIAIIIAFVAFPIISIKEMAKGMGCPINIGTAVGIYAIIAFIVFVITACVQLYRKGKDLTEKDEAEEQISESRDMEQIKQEDEEISKQNEKTLRGSL